MCFINILFFFGVHFLSPDPHLSRFQGGGGGGGVPNTPLFQSPNGFLARHSCKVPSQPPSHAGSFLPFRSSPTRISQTGLKVLQVTLRLRFGVTGRESPTAGQGYSPRSNPSHLDSITPTLPNSLLENRITSWQEISEFIFPLGRLS